MQTISNNMEKCKVLKVDGIESNEEGGDGGDVEDTTSQAKHYWSYEATQLLLQLIGNHVQDIGHTGIRRRRVFKALTSELSSLGYDFTPDAVNNKWKSLIRCYKLNKDKFAKSGKGVCRFEFYSKMDELWDTIPWMSEKSNRDKQIKLNNDVTNDLEGQDVQEDEPTTKRRRIDTKREAAKEQRHKEKMQMEQAKLDATEKMIALEREKLNLIRKLMEK